MPADTALLPTLKQVVAVTPPKRASSASRTRPWSNAV